MAGHSLSPGFIEIQYTYSNLLHKMRLPVQPGNGWATGVEPNLVQKNGVDVPMSTAVDAFITLIKTMFNAATEFVKAEAWFYPTGAGDPIWVYTHALGVAGTAGTPNTNMAQGVITFRTLIGGVFKLYLMEGAFTVNSRNSWPFGAGNPTNVANYLIGSTSWVYGRDNGSLVVPMWFTTKTNDKLRKIRLSM